MGAYVAAAAAAAAARVMVPLDRFIASDEARAIDAVRPIDCAFMFECEPPVCGGVHTRAWRVLPSTWKP